MSLKDDKQQNIQKQLDFSDVLAGEARKAGGEETESSRAANGPESPARTDRLMEEICEPENLKEALRQVKANKGSAGVDRITVAQLTDYLKQHWPAIREQLLSETYEPKPVRRVEIPKPDGGVRKLGIPTVLDRFNEGIASEYGQVRATDHVGAFFDVNTSRRTPRVIGINRETVRSEISNPSFSAVFRRSKIDVAQEVGASPAAVKKTS